jgi:hypothetical protein
LDGKVTISTELDNSGVGKSLKAVKGEFGGLNETLHQTEKAITSAFSRPLELAKAKVADLERQYSRVSSQLNEAKLSGNDAAAQRFGLQQIAIYDRLAAARQRLAIEVQAAAQRQAVAESSSATTQESRLIAAFAKIRSAATGIRNAITRAFSGARVAIGSLAKTIGGMSGGFASIAKSAGRFGTRLRSIISGALVFNLISMGLRKIVSYFGSAISSSNEMKTALANLRGAAQSAAAPIIQVLTPALATLANMLATVLAYFAKILTLFTGTVSSAAKQAVGAAGAAKKAAKSLAGFDEITKLDNPNEGGGGGGSSAAATTPEVTVPDCFEALGQWDMMMQKETGYIKPVPQALTLTHTHGKEGNITAKQFCVFSAEIPLDGETKIKLPADDGIVVFAATAVKKKSVFSKGDAHFDTLEKREFNYEFSDYAVKHMRKNKAEKILDKFIIY